MEIEGIINHTINGLKINFSSIQLESLTLYEQIKKWEEVCNIHANEQIQEDIRGISSIKQLVAAKMEYFLGNDMENSLMYKGYSLKNIQFYMELRDVCDKKTERSIEERLPGES